eukprot:TRINITY_DN33548_c0_g1_i1.p1 TRINITY_DN33548_c0_g1~~TRINITY_DN33548_c0_g1_i1.p1  ORF type:complete len:404 (+),score=19.98 TRINITY_DN33548_c0_g1_i1:72-1283(+)
MKRDEAQTLHEEPPVKKAAPEALDPETSTRVVVRAISGEVLADVPADKLGVLRDVKRVVFECTGVPVMNQRILHGTTLPRDTAIIEDMKAIHGAITLTMVNARPRLVLSGGNDNTMRLWDIEKREAVRSYSHSGWVTCLAVDWVSERAVTGSEDTNLRFFDLERGEAISILRGHMYTVLCLVADWQQQRVLSGSADTRLILWCLTKGELLRTFSGHSDWVCCLDVDWQRDRAVSGGHDGQLRLWDLSRGETIRTFRRPVTSEISVVSCHLVSGQTLLGSSNGTLELWDLRQGCCVESWRSCASAVRCLRVRWGASEALVGYDEGVLEFRDLRSGGVVHRMQESEDCLACMDVDWGMTYAVTGGADGVVRIWYWDASEEGEELLGHQYQVNCLQLKPYDADVVR